MNLCSPSGISSTVLVLHNFCFLFFLLIFLYFSAKPLYLLSLSSPSDSSRKDQVHYLLRLRNNLYYVLSFLILITLLFIIYLYIFFPSSTFEISVKVMEKITRENRRKTKEFLKQQVKRKKKKETHWK